MPNDSPQGGSGPDQLRLINAAWQQIEHAQSTHADDGRDGFLRHRAARRRSARVPDSIPGYRILDEVHRGGQGVVYRALQESTGRTVAIKLLLSGPFAGPAERARFAREVQILASLKHANIVTIHDSGTAGHAAYFVMDYIDGLPLDEYVDSPHLDLRARLTLFTRIGDAVNAAHLRGVIHRDLKPGNIRIDRAGEPHVLDFGLAKHAPWSGSGGDGRDVTITGQFVGSLPWASPEQAQGRPDDIDLRTDVYALGVMLYQLLTGAFPYDVSGSLSATIENIVHREPKSPRQLNRRLDDEINAIAMKALRKEREQRYQSAGALGDDLRRYLAGEPIAARRDSMRYVLRKQLRKHKLAVGVASSFVLLIAVGLVVSLSLWHRAVLARDAEEAQKQLAQTSAALAERRARQAAAEAAKAGAINRFLTDMLSSASPVFGQRADVTVREAVDAAAARLDAQRLADQPDVEAGVRRAIGRTYGTLGAYAAALGQLEAAYALLVRAHGRSHRDVLACAADLADVRRALGDTAGAAALYAETLDHARASGAAQRDVAAQCLIGLAGVRRDRADLHAAETLGREALALLRSLPEPDPMQRATALNDLALALDDLDRIDEAAALQAEALAVFQTTYGDHHHTTAVAKSNLAGLYTKQGRYDDAETLHAEALAVFRAVAGAQHPSVASALGSLGRLYLRQKEYGQAAAALEESLRIRRAALGDEHPLIVNSLNNLAIAQFELGRVDQAAASYQTAIALFRKTRDPAHPAVAALLNNLGAVHRTRGDYEAAERVLREALAIRRASLGGDHPHVATASAGLGAVLKERGELVAAEALLRDAVRIRRRHADDVALLAETLVGLAEVLRARGLLDEAETLCREALALSRQRFGDTHLSVGEGLTTLGEVLLARGQPAEALAEFDDALTILRDALPPEHWRIGTVLGLQGLALAELGRPPEAEAALRAAHDRLAAALGLRHPHTQAIAARLAALYETWNRPDEAAAWRARQSAGGDS